MHDFIAISYLFSPLLIGLTAHGFCIKFGWLDRFARPIDRGAAFRGKRLFGNNKTWRGVVATAIGTAMGFAMQVLVFDRFESVEAYRLVNGPPLLMIGLGLLLGSAAMISELPNSFLKRQLDIAPGKTANGLLNLVFYVLDQIDYLLGVWIVFAFVIDVTLPRIFYSAIFLFVTHQIISRLGFWLGMRKTSR